MAAVTVRNLSNETHRALKVRAANPPDRIRLGSELAAIGRDFGGVELDIERDKTPVEPVNF